MRFPKIPSYVPLIVAALILGIGTAFLVAHIVHNREAALDRALLAKEHEGKVEVVVPQRNLKPGTVADANDMSERLVPLSLVYPSTVTADQWDTFAGRILTHTVYKGRPILASDFAAAAPQGLAARLHPGERAITITVSNTNGIAGFIEPGNRVDILLLGHPQGQHQTEELPLLRHVRVLATGHLDEPVSETTTNGEPITYDTLTLALHPAQAARLAIAEKVGSLRVILQPKYRPAQGPVPTLDGDDLFGLAPAPKEAAGVQFIIGGGSGNEVQEQPILPELPLAKTSTHDARVPQLSPAELRALRALTRASAGLPTTTKTMENP